MVGKVEISGKVVGPIGDNDDALNITDFVDSGEMSPAMYPDIDSPIGGRCRSMWIIIC
jgi:hypothetical protein